MDSTLPISTEIIIPDNHKAARVYLRLNGTFQIEKYNFDN
jgi:hypothetical protein